MTELINEKGNLHNGTPRCRSGYVHFPGPGRRDPGRVTDINLVVVYPGGPSTEEEGKKMISQFISTIAKVAGLSPSSMDGAYFTEIRQAKNHIRLNRNSFIMGSLGFYLSNMKTLNLVPLTSVRFSQGDREQYHVIVKKGSYRDIKGLKGKVLTGNVLYEDSRYINSIIFDNVINAQNYFVLKPTSRPLTALRRAAQGKVDAVLVNQIQYQSLKGMSIFDNLESIYHTEPLPTVGLMMVDTKKNNSVRNRIVDAVTQMCYMPDGKDVCKSFGISGFEKLAPEALDNVVKKYHGNR